MEVLSKIEKNITAILERNYVEYSQIKNIIELVRVYGTIQYTNGEINQITKLSNEIKSNNS